MRVPPVPEASQGGNELAFFLVSFHVQRSVDLAALFQCSFTDAHLKDGPIRVPLNVLRLLRMLGTH